MQLWLGERSDAGAGRGAVLLKALLGKFTCGIPARMQKRDLTACPEKCQHGQEVAGAKPSKFFLLQTLCPSPKSDEEQMKSRLFSGAVISMSREQIWHQPLWVFMMNNSVLGGDPRVCSVGQGGKMVGTALKALNS